MIKKYNQYIKESLKYSYPFDRIMILINSYEDYLKVVNYVENTFNISVYNSYHMENRNDSFFSHVLLDVDYLYNLIKTNKPGETHDDDDVFRFYTFRVLPTDELIHIITNNGENYVNEKDILNINELNSIMNLLMYGKKNAFMEIYNKGNALVYESLLDNLKGPSEEDIKNNKKLELAVEKGNIKGVKRLLDKGANIHILKDYPLRHFAYKGNLEMVKYLVEHGAYIDAFDGESIIVASCEGHLDIVKYLVENGADIHTRNEQALTYAIKNNYLDIVKYLIDVGCGKISYLHKNFIRDARKTGNTELIKYIGNIFNNQVKESLLDKLDGPSKEEYFKGIGFDRIFDTAEEYLNFLIDSLVIETRSYYTHDKDKTIYRFNDKDIFILVINFKRKKIAASKKYFWNVLDAFEECDTHHKKWNLLYNIFRDKFIHDDDFNFEFDEDFRLTYI